MEDIKTRKDRKRRIAEEEEKEYRYQKYLKKRALYMQYLADARKSISPENVPNDPDGSLYNQLDSMCNEFAGGFNGGPIEYECCEEWLPLQEDSTSVTPSAVGVIICLLVGILAVEQFFTPEGLSFGPKVALFLIEAVLTLATLVGGFFVTESINERKRLKFAAECRIMCTILKNRKSA
jgi:hypothetical protein